MTEHGISTTAPGYFGKMTAAISHELKNCLAIINENNGLLQDFSAMAQNGRPLEPARVDQVAERISRQISRADGLLRQMNRFAHSVDYNRQQVDLGEAASLSAALGARLAANRQVQLEVIPSRSHPPVNQSFFGVLHLLWQTMEALMSAMARETVLTIQVATIDDAIVQCTASAPFIAPVEPALKAADVYYLGSEAGAAIHLETDHNRLILAFDKQDK